MVCRIWVLQEVAAARHVQLMCGSEEIDGNAFCLGLESLNINLEHSMNSMVTYLIRGAIFRPRRILQKGQKISLDILSLGELVDMYHTRQASICHDKVYALLSISSDDLSVAGLKPDYSVPWEVLMQRLAKYLLGGQASIETWNDKEMATIKSKGFVFGQVSSINSHSGGIQDIEIIHSNALQQIGNSGNRNSCFTLQASAKPIQNGDIICLLQGTSKPTIVRLCGDHFAIIVIAVTPFDFILSEDEFVTWPDFSQSASYNRDFLLVWDWGTCQATSKILRRNYNTWIRESSQKELHRQLEVVTGLWDAAQILGDSGDYEMAEEKLRGANKIYREALIDEYLPTLDNRCYPILLSLAAANGHEAVVRLVLDTTKAEVDTRDWDGRTPLLWATENGHEAVVRLLLNTGKVEVDAEDWDCRTPLSLPAENGHEVVVRVLLDTGKVDVDTRKRRNIDHWLKRKRRSFYNDGTPVWRAAANGHKTVVRLLINTGKVDIDYKGTYCNYEKIKGLRSYYSVTPLWMAAAKGHKSIVKLLLDTRKVDIVVREYFSGQTPLLMAAEGGHETVVKLLLDTGKVDVGLQSPDKYGRTALWVAAAGGHEAVVKLLLATGKVDVNSKSWRGSTPLSEAARGGHEVVFKLLLDTGEAEYGDESEDEDC